MRPLCKARSKLARQGPGRAKRPHGSGLAAAGPPGRVDTNTKSRSDKWTTRPGRRRGCRQATDMQPLCKARSKLARQGPGRGRVDTRYQDKRLVARSDKWTRLGKKKKIKKRKDRKNKKYKRRWIINQYSC